MSAASWDCRCSIAYSISGKFMSLAGIEKWKPGGEYDRAARLSFEAFQRGEYDRSYHIFASTIGPPIGPMLWGLCLGVAIGLGILVAIR